MGVWLEAGRQPDKLFFKGTFTLARAGKSSVQSRYSWVQESIKAESASLSKYAGGSLALGDGPFLEL